MPSLPRDQRQDAIKALSQYCAENLDEPVGNLAIEALLDFIAQDLGPLFYNQGVQDAQARLQGLITDLDQDVYAEPFTYWRRRK